MSIADQDGQFPAEVFAPDILAWMKQLDCNIRLAIRIDSGDIRPLEAVAIEATQCQILSNGLSTVLLSDNVVNLKWKPCVGGWKQALLTPMLRTVPDQILKRLLHPL